VVVVVVVGNEVHGEAMVVNTVVAVVVNTVVAAVGIMTEVAAVHSTTTLCCVA